jgi:hypothetical protein
MNKLIEELVSKAAAYALSETASAPRYDMLQKLYTEKLVELVAQECSNWVIKNSDSMEHLGPESFAKEMISFFGVEK